MLKSVTVSIPQSFQDQEPGTSGLRKNVKVYKQQHYTESFVQSILSSLGTSLKGSTLILGGDGRYYVKEAAQIIVKMCAANGVGKIYVGKSGILSTPAASNLIRKLKADGGIILTASHNPGGPDKDFGIKFNISNGGPAPTNVTSMIYEISKKLKEYKTVPGLTFDLETIAKTQFKIDDSITEVEVIDPVESYVKLMKEIFDFKALQEFIKNGNFKIVIDAMHGVTGPYAKAIFEDELNASIGCVVNGVPREDFGGGHPDPNLTYAKELIEILEKGRHDLGAAFDGDGDRNMVLGRRAFFVAPSDSLAVIASNLKYIPYFEKHAITGFARSMPTAASVDVVGKELGIPVYEVPTGWKFFGNLMDCDKVCLCGEESFGLGSNHIREKDGIWAVLAWLTVIQKSGQSVQDIVMNHWKLFGRNYTMRMDYENVSNEAAKNVMNELVTKITAPNFPGAVLEADDKKYVVKLGDNYSYVDSTDQSVTKNQGLRVIMTDGSRIVYRLSGTGSSGATIRIYLEAYDKDDSATPTEIKLRPLYKIALSLSNIALHTQLEKPTVIT